MLCVAFCALIFTTIPVRLIDVIYGMLHPSNTCWPPVSGCLLDFWRRVCIDDNTSWLPGRTHTQHEVNKGERLCCLNDLGCGLSCEGGHTWGILDRLVAGVGTPKYTCTPSCVLSSCMPCMLMSLAAFLVHQPLLRPCPLPHRVTLKTASCGRFLCICRSVWIS